LELWVVRSGEDNPKKCTALRVVKAGLADLVDGPRGLLLNPFSETLLAGDLSPTDLTALDVSWNLLESFSRHQPAVRLPLLVAVNPTNYGKLHKLSTAEALASACWILGRQEQAEKLMACFKWGPHFLELNRERLEAYRLADSRTIQEAEQRQVELLAGPQPKRL